MGDGAACELTGQGAPEGPGPWLFPVCPSLDEWGMLCSPASSCRNMQVELFLQRNHVLWLMKYGIF